MNKTRTNICQWTVSELITVDNERGFAQLVSSVARLGGFNLAVLNLIVQVNIGLDGGQNLGWFGVSLAVFKHINYIG